MFFVTMTHPSLQKSKAQMSFVNMSYPSLQGTGEQNILLPSHIHHSTGQEHAMFSATTHCKGQENQMFFVIICHPLL